ncbi:hypothetical protein SmedWSM1115_15185 [Sinorhizobium medicae WSM1115]|uniref:hypothetical protein n=1 Tax=Sinorhizobium medicae TaxID=110321 RepID=UPI0003628AF6|nr:hypothetical protein [Sinorhizobium medicae]UFX01131.1 hypothetical protein SmedWSM1115_15185 [Sinorhizobium medicae WSM1115]
MVPEIIKDLRENLEPYQLSGVNLPPRGVRAMLLLLVYLETEWRNMECRLNGTAGPVLHPHGNVIPFRQHSPGTSPDGGAA